MVFFAAHFFLHRDEGFEIENPGSESATQIHHRAVRNQIAIGPAISDATEHIEWTKTGYKYKKIVPSCREVRRLWFQATFGLRPINRVQFSQSGNHAREVVRVE